MPTPAPSPGLQPLPARLAFGRFELRPAEARLLRDGEPVALGGRAFDLLLALAQRSARVVPRSELIEAVWPGRVVEENNLSVQVNTLRKVLGGEWLVTVPGRGYRFVLPEAAPAAEPAAPPPAAPRVRTHLPTAQPLLVGRSEDLAALGTLIEQHRLVTLVGPGGTGKTRLAQALLGLREGAYAQGVCWVELGSVAEAGELPSAVASALGLRTAPGSGAEDALAQALAGLQILVALDNAEHLLPAVAALAQRLLLAAPGLRLLVTSQAPLKLAEERVLRLAGLAVPQGTLPALQAQAFGAVALFTERAQAADSRFVLHDADVPRVIELCRQLDGNALAIELAAARVPLLGLDRLLAALPERLRVLTANRRRDAPLRQQTLRAALQWSHELLAPREQRLFMRLAVVAGSASLALVQALAGEGEDAWAALDALDELVQRSLVEVNVEAVGGAGEPRYRLLESPRALAQEHLAASGEAPALRLRHAQAMAQLLEAAERAHHAGESGVEAWRQAGEQELDNARAALAHAHGTGDQALQLSLAAALLVLLPPAQHNERLALAARVEALAARCVSAALRCRGWMAVSTALASADPPRSRAAAEGALTAARELGDTDEGRWQRYRALCEAADIVGDELEAAEAQALLDEALALEDPAWPPVRRRSSVRVAAGIAAARGDAHEALRLDRELLALSRAAGDPSPMTLINIADSELRTGDARAAVASGRALLQQLAAQRDDNHLAYAQLNLAAAWLALGEAPEARALLQATWAGAQRVRRQAWWCDHAALLAALEGRPDAAARLVGAADARYAALQEPRQFNEAQGHERTLALLAAALAGEALARLRVEGALLADEALPALAFGAGAPAR